MSTNEKINRRDFIRTSVMTTGALLTSTTISGQAMNLLRRERNDTKLVDDGILKNVCDIHLHCHPDSRTRSVDEYSFMRESRAAGYRAVMF